MAEVPGGTTAWRGRRLHTVSGRAWSSHSWRRPSGGRRGPGRPLQVLGDAQRLLDPLAQPGQLDHLGVVKARPGPQCLRHLDPADPAGGRVEAVGERLLAHRARTQLHGDLVDGEPVGGDLALDHGRAEPVGGLDGDLGAVPGQRVEGEQHPGGLGRDHRLDDHAHGDLVVADPQPGPVGDRPVGEQAGPAALDVGGHVLGPPDPQVGVLLAGERGLGGVLGGGAGADRHRHPVVAQAQVGGRDLGRQPVPDPGRPATAGQRLGVGGGGDGEPGGHPVTLADQVTKAEGLAADQRRGLGAALLQPQDMAGTGHRLASRPAAVAQRGLPAGQMESSIPAMADPPGAGAGGHERFRPTPARQARCPVTPDRRSPCPTLAR